MNSYNPYAVGSVSEQPEDTRAEFIRKTYWHLAGAVGAFVLLEALFLSMGLGNLALSLLGTSRFAWLIVLGGFMVVGWLATRMVHTATSPATQYLALGIYTLAEAVIFLPLMAYAVLLTGSPAILG